MPGLVLLLAALSVGSAAEVEILATSSGYVERMWTPDTTRYLAQDGDLVYGYVAYVSPPSSVTWYGTCGFDLSPVPDSAVVSAVTLSFFQGYDTGATPAYRVRLFDNRSLPAESLYRAISSGMYLSETRLSVRGWQTFALNDSAVRAVRERLGSDRIDMALVNAGGECRALVYGCQGRESLGPRLRVTYQPGGLEADRRGTAQSAARIEPSPFRTTARLVGVEPGRFEVRDGAGRRVLGGNGITFGAGLAPGVYYVFLPSERRPLRAVKLPEGHARDRVR